MRGHGPLSEAEWAQLEAELSAAAHGRPAVWPGGFWTLVAALVLGVLM